MIPLDFIEFIPASKDDRHLGIASVKWGGMILRFKIQPTQDQKSYFATPASYKVKDQITQEDKYLHAFEIDSRSEHDRVTNFVKSNVKVQLGHTSVNPGKPMMPPGSGGWAHPTGPATVPEMLQQNLPF